MNIYDKLMCYSKEEMATFLFIFARDTVDELEKFQFPSYNAILEFLNREVPQK